MNAALQAAVEVVGKAVQQFENAAGPFTIVFSYHFGEMGEGDKKRKVLNLIGYREGYPIKFAPYMGNGTLEDSKAQATEAFRALKNGLGVPLEGTGGDYARADGAMWDSEERGFYSSVTGKVVD